MRFKFAVTYCQTTPESAEDGDYSDSGWALPGGWRFSNTERSTLPDARRGEFDQYADSLEELLDVIRDLGCLEPSVSPLRETDPPEAFGRVWLSSGFYVKDYRTGESEELAVHLDTTPRNVKRILRALGVLS